MTGVAEFREIVLFKGMEEGYSGVRRTHRVRNPRSLPMFSRLALAATFVLGLPALLPAQYNNLRNPRHPQQQPLVASAVDIQGVIEGVTRGGVIVQDNSGQRWQVMVPPAARVHVTGSANADYLQSGLTVEFKAEVNDRGTIKDKVDSLTLITLSADRQMGLYPSEAAGDQGGLAAGDDGKAGKTKHAAGKAGATPAGAYRIVGRLIVGRNKLSVNTGRGTLALELGEQPTIAIDVSDYMMAAKGDKVTVKAIKMPTRSGPAVAALEMKIELAEPLVGAKKRGAKPESKRPAKSSKKDEGLPEPAADK
jgi:hypothetical protein